MIKVPFKNNRYWKSVLGRSKHQATYHLLQAVGSDIQESRKQAGWTQEDLAYESGLSVMTIWNVEHAKTLPRLTTLLMILDSLGLKLTFKGFEAVSSAIITARKNKAA